MRNSLGTLLASREEEEVLEVNAGDLVLQRQLLLQSCGDASGSRPSKVPTVAKTRAGACIVLGGEAGHEAERQIMARQNTRKSKACVLL